MLELDIFLFIMEQYIYKINKSLLYVDDLVKKIKIMALKKLLVLIVLRVSDFIVVERLRANSIGNIRSLLKL